jgi:hypothetical protein
MVRMLNTKESHMNNSDRHFQQRLELIFKKAEYDRMQEFRRQRELEAAKKCPNDNEGTPTTKKSGFKKPGLG